MQQPEEGRGAIGFLTTVASASHGVFGGYLLVDEVGRPLEFHCTAPVRVSRAQEILYGPTLHGELHGRRIGGSLVAAAGVRPRLVLVESPQMMHVQGETDLPVAVVDPVEPLRERFGSLLPEIDLLEPFERIREAIAEAQRHG
ncbi:MAG: hypothetical protein ISQ70_03250 [Pirellulales bacterium]|jgi:hypothetical protein|nr:hypothetical protein [Pirellulales bacterium]MBL7194277.1 hypothetical protein [Pirellulales bacterium]MDA0818189.1 hypothetical protein [Planctomycetota bacterium]MDA0969996.1 hypothetical protein [Planctomycetota bacterium]